MQLTSLDHLVLTVRNLNESLHFYSEVLGLRQETFGEGRHAVQVGLQKINLHEREHEFEPKAEHPTPGSGDLCFLTDAPPEQTLAELERLGVPVEIGPVARQGAQAPLQSIYLRDPDGNLIEIATPSR